MIPPIANRFVASESIPGLIDHIENLEEYDIGAIVNLLGEHYTEPSLATSDVQTYLELIEASNSVETEICISLKPTQIGLSISKELFYENLESIIRVADNQNVFVWLDMESSSTTDETIEAFETFTKRYPDNVGICLQANLRRTKGDLERLVDQPGKVRLVKGAYNESPDIAYQKKSKVNEAYKNLIRYSFRHFDDGVAVATHDETMLHLARELQEEYGTAFEYQMLMGVRTESQLRLAKNYTVYQYVPFGSKWLSYFYRRLSERKENILFAIRAILNKN